MSIGNSSEHVLDAISSCEQYAKEVGAQERNAPWRLFFRKEIFTPWHNAGKDKVATGLVYEQVIRGVKNGEYRFNKDEGYADVAAKQWYVDFGSEIQMGKLRIMHSHYIPEREIDDDDGRGAKYWTDAIIKLHRQSKQVRQRWEPHRVKQDLVHQSRLLWPLKFSRFYEVKFISSTAPNMPVEIKSGQNLILAVNWSMVFLVDNKENMPARFTYPELTNINCNRDDDGQVTSFWISTIKNEEYSLSSPESEDIRDLVTQFLDGLKRRSKYAVAMQANPNKVSDNSQFVKFEKGDLLVLEKSWGDLQKTGQAWSIGTNSKTKQTGDFPMDCVYVLPTLTKPHKEVLEMFTAKTDIEDITRISNPLAPADGFNENQIFTLEEFAKTHMREQISQSGIFGNKLTTTIWEWSKDPIKMPLLKSLCHNEDLSKEAVEMFQSIMKYMGDYPSRKPRHGNDLTDMIFNAPLNSENLRDECYVQLCKQVTGNINPQSEEHGWELLWLATGLFAPTQGLVSTINKFLAGRKEINPIAKDCIYRLQKTLRVELGF